MIFLIIITVIFIIVFIVIFISNLNSSKQLFGVKPSEELVVVVCNEDIHWIDKQAHEYTLITVYNKCNKSLNFQAKNVKVFNIPNIGSCDNGYLHYIIDRYDSLPDLVEFTKGSSPGNHLYEKCNTCTFDENNFNNLMNFSLNNWQFRNDPVMSKKSKFIKSQYKNMREWIKANNLDEKMYSKNICNIIYGGHFGATSKQIQNIPKDTYIFLKNMQKYPQEEVDHFIERTWRPLLCKENFSK